MDKMLAGSLYLAVVEAMMYRPTRAPASFEGTGGKGKISCAEQESRVLGVSSPWT